VRRNFEVGRELESDSEEHCLIHRRAHTAVPEQKRSL
jgi:hypothetical protein